MKPTQIAELLANIKATVVSFFSILMFVALGVGIFAGIYWMAPALEETVNEAYEESSLYDIQIAFPYGLSDDDVQTVKGSEGVSDVEPTRQSFQSVERSEDDYSIKVQSIPERINTLKLTEGRLPTNSDEIVMTPQLAATLGVVVGDTITFDADNEGGSATTSSAADGSTDSATSPMRYLTSQSFKLVGLVQSGEYLAYASETFGFASSGTGTIHGMAWVPIDAFVASAYYEGWPVVNVRYGELEGVDTFSASYKSRTGILKEQLDTLGETLAKQRYASIHDEAQAKIDDGQAKIDDAKAKIKGAEEQIASAKQKAADGETQIANGEATLQNGYAQIAEGEALLASKKAEYATKKADAEAQLAEGKQTIDELQSAYDEASAEVQSQKQALEFMQARYDAVKQGAAAAQTAIDDLNASLPGLETAADEGAEDVGDTTEEPEDDSSEGDTSEGDSSEGESAEDEGSETGESDESKAAWQAAYAKYANLQAQFTVLNANIAAYNQSLEAIKQSNPDSTIEATLPAMSELPALSGQASEAHDAAALQELEEALAKASADLVTLNETPIKVDDVSTTFADADSLSSVGAAEIAEAEAALAALKSGLDAARAEYDKGLEQYNSMVAYAEQQIVEGEAQLASSRQQAAEGEAKLAAAREELATGRQQIKEKEAALEDAKNQLKEKESELEDAKEKLGFLKEYQWTVSQRIYNGGAVEASTFADIMNRLSYSMAALFVVVGLLVSYSAVSRIVHEQIVQIGTKKALGLRFREITTSFLLYSSLAVISGAILGLIVGTIVVEGIIGHSLCQRFVFDRIPPFFDIKLALLATGIELLLVLGATWFACHKILREQAVELLKGERPPEGKERFFEKWTVWDNLPLYTQTIINNCLNDKRRVFSTVVGVAGCTSLVVTALTLNNDVLASYDKQYENVFDFDAIAFVNTDVKDAEDNVVDILAQTGVTATPVLRQSKALSLPSGEFTLVRILVPEDIEAFLSLYHVNSKDGSPVDISGDGVWITEAYANHSDEQVGDTLEINGSDGAVYELPIAGFYEFYLARNEIVMSQELYESVFGSKPESNAVLINSGDQSLETLGARLTRTKGYLQIVDDKETQRTIFKQFANVSRTVVLVYLSLSILMAIVVLLNLNVMFIEEKKRELIVLMINGFSTNDAKRYIYQDTILLTIIGIIFGLVLGTVMGSASVASIEPVSASFFKGIDLRAQLAGIGTSAVLSFMMSLIALRRIPRFNLTDINKL